MSALSLVTEDVGKYVHWGVVQISVTNLVIIGLMVLLFILALVVPFGSGHSSQADRERRK